MLFEGKESSFSRACPAALVGHYLNKLVNGNLNIHFLFFAKYRSGIWKKVLMLSDFDVFDVQDRDVAITISTDAELDCVAVQSSIPYNRSFKADVGE